jgi:hypothetical protein
MATTYRGPAVTLAEMFDELCENGRSLKEAYAELRRAIKDGAIDLIDLHDPPWADDRLYAAALDLLDAASTNRRTAAMWHPDYFRKGDVVVLRDQFETVFGLRPTSQRDEQAGHWSVPKITAFAREYIQTVENPGVKDFEEKIQAAGLRGNRDGARKAFKDCYREKHGAPPARGRPRRVH